MLPPHSERSQKYLGFSQTRRGEMRTKGLHTNPHQLPNQLGELEHTLPLQETLAQQRSASHIELIPVSLGAERCPGVLKTGHSHLSIWFVGFHQLHGLASSHEHHLGVPQPSHVQHISSDESHHAGGSTAQTLQRVKKTPPAFNKQIRTISKWLNASDQLCPMTFRKRGCAAALLF